MNKRLGGGSWNRRGKSSTKELGGMRRQRSLEWRNERDCSSSDEEIARPVESQMFATLLAQAQKEFKDDIERNYRSDDTEEAITTDNPTTPFPTPPPTLVSPRSPIPLHRQASPFPLESINNRRINYQTPQDRLRGVGGEVIFATGNKKTLSNNATLGRSGRRHRMGGMTSSSSATSCNSNCNDNILQPNGDISYHEHSRRLSHDVTEDSPPEPAPPEIPPRGGSLHSATLRGRTQYQLPPGDDLPSCQEPQYIPGATSSTARYCVTCKLEVPSSRWTGHLRTLQHRNKCCVVQEEGVQLVKTSFRSRLATYRLEGTEDSTNVKRFLDHLKNKAIALVESSVNLHSNIKVGLELFGRFLLQTKEATEVKSFNTKFRIVGGDTDLEELFAQVREIIDKKTTEFAEKDSGWALQQLLYLELSINRFNPLKASSYLPLPKEIDRKLAVLNIQNSDEKCFTWSVLAALHPLDRSRNPERVNHYKVFENELDFSGMCNSPMKLVDIPKFEELNGISINVYGLDKVFENGKNIIEVVGPLHFTKSRKPRHVNLLLISDDYGNNHYCLIRNMSRLISSQLSKHHGVKYLCDGCLVFFYSDDKLKAHQANDCRHVSIKMPTTNLRKDKYGKEAPENELKFTNFEKKLKVPFVVYADFETIVEPVETEENELPPNQSYTIKTHKHTPYSFAYYIKCSFDDSHSVFRTYRGENASEKFIEMLESDCKRLYNNFIKIRKPMAPLTPEEESKFETMTVCHICEKPFNVGDERVRDHDHLTSKFRGAAHSVCNVNFKVPKFIPIFFHNMSGFDSHLMIKQLATEQEKLDVIAQNKERYVSFTKHILVDTIKVEKGGQQNVFLKLRFLDSFRFMASSLDKLSQNLKSEQCREVRKYFPDEDKFELIRQKGVFPYSFVDSFSKLEVTELPSHEDFYNDLKKEDISREEYKRAWVVWNLFKCENLGQYSDIYLKSDVLLLADVFESFRDVCLSTYALDPACYFTSPGLALDAALKYTGINLELLTDLDMVHFFKHGIRGGVSQCSVRKGIANNKFVPHYDASKPTSYILYLDATNLYGAAMSQYLPTGNFKWLDENEIKNLDYMSVPKDSSTGYVLEVDLEYPDELHDLHNDLPFCPQSIEPPKSNSRITKLIPNFIKKEKYVIHCQNLRQVLDHGLKLTQIHRVLCFDQSPWLKKYIDLNTAMRNQAQNKFEKDFFKLMNNAVFGKTMENVEKRIDVRLVTHWENVGRRLGAEALIAKPHFKNFTIFSENLVAIQMQKQQVRYNKPIYAGFAILDISKTIMYDFLYGFIKPKYGNNAVLLYTDTDSLILQITTENFYNDMRENLDKFDTSNYSENNQHNIPVNSSVLGLMKDEYAGKIIWEFYGTGAKAYCVNVEGELTKKAKGVPDYVTKKELTLEDYKTAVDVEGTKIFREMSTFRSHSHDMYVELKNKVALSHADDKRYIIPDSEFTLAWGHRDLRSFDEGS